MKTTLPASITSIDEAKQFLTDLHNNNESFHPEDDAFDIYWQTTEVSDEEKELLNKLMNDIYSLPEAWSRTNPDGWCPCGYLNDLNIKFNNGGIAAPFEITGQFTEHTTVNGVFSFTPDWFESDDAKEWYSYNWEKVNDLYNERIGS